MSNVIKLSVNLELIFDIQYLKTEYGVNIKGASHFNSRNKFGILIHIFTIKQLSTNETRTRFGLEAKFSF